MPASHSATPHPTTPHLAAPRDLSALIKAYDVRGLVPEQFDVDVARAIGAAFADVVVLPEHGGGAGDGASAGVDGSAEEGDVGPRVVIGRDMRPSGPELSEAFAAGLADRGVGAVLIGLCSTDGLYHASGVLDLPGAMFTASHNPAGYNGIKLCRTGARPVGQDSGLLAVREQAERYLAQPGGSRGDTASGAVGTGAGGPAHRGRVERHEMLPDYAAFLRGLVDLSAVRPLRVVVDAGNGMAGLTVPAVLGEAAGLSGLPLEVLPLYFELDGTFPNHEANPLEPENLRDLQAAVVAHGADIGLAFDGDADRCFVVDENGDAVSPSAVTALVGLREVALERAAGREATVIHNLITSRVVPEVIGGAGARTVRTRVGHSFIKEVMAQHEAVFGGEHSAHYYFRDFFFADSGMLAAMHVLAALGEQEGPLSALAAAYQPYAASGEVNSRVADGPAATARVLAAFTDPGADGRPGGTGPEPALGSAADVVVDTLDGLTVDHWDAEPRWWFNLRASNTEPLLRLNVEAADEAVMVRVRDAVLGLVREAH